MSFRRRGEALNGGHSIPRAVPGRAVPGRTLPSSVNTNTEARGGIVNGRPIPNRGSGSQSENLARRMGNMNLRDRTGTVGTPSGTASPVIEGKSSVDLNHPGIRPSPVSATLATSTGSNDLDVVLTHMGLPLGNSLLVEERGSTEFNSILAKLFASQGIIHNRIEAKSGQESSNTHLIVVTLNQGFAKELPGVYKGSKKEIKKLQISEEQSKLSVQNLANQKSTPSRYNDLKIAWKYKYADEQKEKLNAKRADNKIENNDDYKDYNHQFDITSRIMPAPTSSEITFISPNQPVSTILTQIEQVIKKQQKKLIRIIIPQYLHPAMYQPKFFSLSNSISLVHGLRSIVKYYGDRCVLFCTISTDIQTKLLRIQLENLFDSVINLEPFPQDMLQFLERTYKSQPNKVQHGLLHVLKLPIFSERGEMQVKKSEWAFRNGRKKFEVDEWSIPVEDVEDSGKKQPAQPDTNSYGQGHDHDHSKSDTTAPKNTKVSLEY